jgi:mono/diheme cytochrome c family protein
MLASSLACDSGRKSPAGFRLPEGNIEAGKAAFVALKCNACHEVTDMDFPDPVADPPVPVRLGGETPYLRTDGELVTSMIYPSHKLAYGHPRELIESGGESRMADYREVMTVQQLADMVAFLQSTYTVVPPRPIH